MISRKDDPLLQTLLRDRPGLRVRAKQERESRDHAATIERKGFVGPIAVGETCLRRATGFCSG